MTDKDKFSKLQLIQAEYWSVKKLLKRQKNDILNVYNIFQSSLSNGIVGRYLFKCGALLLSTN